MRGIWPFAAFYSPSLVAGGGSQSNAAMQITADVFGLPAERPQVYETSALGAAINLAVGPGLHADYPQAVAKMTRVGARLTPNPEAQRIYDALYREVYQSMYRRASSYLSPESCS